MPVELGDFVTKLGGSVSSVVGAEVDEPSGGGVVGGEVLVPSRVELTDGSNVGKVVIGAGVGDIVSDVSVGE